MNSNAIQAVEKYSVWRLRSTSVCESVLLSMLFTPDNVISMLEHLIDDVEDVGII